MAEHRFQVFRDRIARDQAELLRQEIEYAQQQEAAGVPAYVIADGLGMLKGSYVIWRRKHLQGMTTAGARKSRPLSSKPKAVENRMYARRARERKLYPQPPEPN